MLNSVNGSIQNDTVVQKNKIQKSNIAYRGKATDALDFTPEKDEFKKGGLDKGSKILLGIFGLAGIAVAVDRLFLKGKYTDDILKWLKNNTDDTTKGFKEGTDDFKRLDDDCINIDIPPEDLKILDDLDFEELADDAELVLGDSSVTKKADDIINGVFNPIEKTVKETTEEVRLVTPSKNEVLENIEDEIIKTKKHIGEVDSQVIEVKPIDDADSVIKKAIKELELDKEAEKAAKKQQEEAQRIEADILDIAASVIFTDDALRQGKYKVDDLVEDLSSLSHDLGGCDTDGGFLDSLLDMF